MFAFPQSARSDVDSVLNRVITVFTALGLVVCCLLAFALFGWWIYCVGSVFRTLLWGSFVERIGVVLVFVGIFIELSMGTAVWNWNRRRTVGETWEHRQRMWYFGTLALFVSAAAFMLSSFGVLLGEVFPIFVTPSQFAIAGAISCFLWAARRLWKSP